MTEYTLYILDSILKTGCFKYSKHLIEIKTKSATPLRRAIILLLESKLGLKVYEADNGIPETILILAGADFKVTAKSVDMETINDQLLPSEILSYIEELKALN
jgi:hypothetical protein